MLFFLPMQIQASPWRIGTKARIGGRYDNIRMCVATDPGVNGGPAMDISIYAGKELSSKTVLEFDLPAMRPILFGAAFKMLQFEPSVTLKISVLSTNNLKLQAGPMAGISMHYGPDVDSDSSGTNRTRSFFAMGPILGGYGGITILRPHGKFDIQVGITVYTIPLWSINDPENHNGFVLGGSLDIAMLWK
ncbi:hypothetical protein KKF34_14010 [Myxococcota bacterium]|nr:hypothetical protein [Myxococcota bacterium]MBU1379656.1 hypothetical protein [Myxococcota bacterium]MBU1497987.1 hypothetical protein [Myxococcota bacterium]